MAEMSAGLANCFCGQPRLKPPLNPSAGQFSGFAVAAAFCAKPTEPVNTTAAKAAPIPNGFGFMIGCSLVMAAWNPIVMRRDTATVTRAGKSGFQAIASFGAAVERTPDQSIHRHHQGGHHDGGQQE